jgi:hypothetical protein
MSFRFHVSGFKAGAAVVIVAQALLNVQWHYDRMCATVFSPRAYFKLDGVYCETDLRDSGVEFKLSELLERHERVRQQAECMAANPDNKFMCDPRWIAPSGEGSG